MTQSEKTYLCQFITDKGDEIGASGEYEHDGGIYCNSEADDVLRPQGGWHIREYGSRVPFCHRHATFLVEDAHAGWEMIEIGSLSQIPDDYEPYVSDEKRPDNLNELVKSHSGVHHKIRRRVKDSPMAYDIIICCCGYETDETEIVSVSSEEVDMCRNCESVTLP